MHPANEPNMAKLAEQFKEFLRRNSVGEVLDKEGSIGLCGPSVTRAQPFIIHKTAHVRL
jgi:hypothetical protein